MSTKGTTSPTFSCEFFPPKTDKGAENLWRAAAELAQLNPAFMTMTYGAGGSTKEGTYDAATKIAALTNVPMVAHLTCATTSKKDLGVYVDRLYDAGIKHIIALRGDLPADWEWPKNDPDYFDYSSQFVSWLKERHDFEISVGTYPEKHPDAPRLQADIEALRLKVDAGADRAITQFFFENDCFFGFEERVKEAGIDVPLVPGLLPIMNFENMCGFAARCQASVPAWLGEKFEGVEAESDEAFDIATTLLGDQIKGLVEGGVPHIHFYALNKAEYILEACNKAGLS